MSSKYPQLEDREWLEAQYLTGHRSINEIASEVGCTGMTVHRALKLHEIPRRPPSEHRPKYPELADPEWLGHHYIDREMSAGEMAGLLGCTDSGVRAALIRENVPLRGSHDSRRLRAQRQRESVDSAEAIDLYVGQSRTLSEIGQHFGVSEYVVRQVLVRNGVQIRLPRERMRLVWAQNQTRLRAVAERRGRPTGVRSMKRIARDESDQCAFCGERDCPIQTHHLNAVRSDDTAENLVPLCLDCHRKVEWFIGHAVRGLGVARR